MGRVIVMLVGRPLSDGYTGVCNRAGATILEEGANACFSKKQSVHLRGATPAVNVGISHAQGSQEPHNLSHGAHSAMLQRLLANPDIQRIAGFTSSKLTPIAHRDIAKLHALGALEHWNPKLYSYIKQVHLDVKGRVAVRSNFSNSVFPAAAFNFGPQVCCQPHRDSLNFACGWCGIHPLGDFDPEKGGHLVLHELKLMIEFPPMSLILIPSAVLTHSNAAIRKGETRVSFTQYCPGGLFRWRDNGFRTQSALAKASPELFEQMQAAKLKRWKEGLEMLPKWRDLEKKMQESGQTVEAKADDS
ncbi:hypothetical protein EST38_g13259 [Candolleomyces aberdarensis]|uniref:Uncharacterized protein n=1 Tax=Candolleomyces aberdarensis TaxID=2316362 RepID=A0A4Q2D2B0_9AGAR|nr:hypothetical protein EST38_g13259 [Candolleomyces aberdarensis]